MLNHSLALVQLFFSLPMHSCVYVGGFGFRVKKATVAKLYAMVIETKNILGTPVAGKADCSSRHLDHKRRFRGFKASGFPMEAWMRIGSEHYSCMHNLLTLPLARVPHYIITACNMKPYFNCYCPHSNLINLQSWDLIMWL